MKTAIIGMGRMGRLRRDLIAHNKALNLVAVCDFSASHLDSAESTVAHYSDWRKLLDQERPDVVFVCTYNNVIPDIVCEALARGCHVFSEKPPGRYVEDALRMKRAKDAASGQVLKFGFNHRLHNSVMEAQAMLESGRLGRIVCARGVYGKAGAQDFASQWRSNPQMAGGGILLDQGIHMLDLLMYFMGDLNLVASAVDNLVWKDIPMEDNAAAIMRSSSGGLVLFHSSATQWCHVFRLELQCENGYLHLEGLNTSTKSYGEEIIRVGYKNLDNKFGKIGMPNEQIYYFNDDNSWSYEIDEFISAINHGPGLIQHGTIDDAVRLMSLVWDIYKFSGTAPTQMLHSIA